MIIKLTHPFLKRCHDINGLLQDTVKLSTFLSKLENQSLLFPDRYEPNAYKGAGFELFGEALIKLFPCDSRIGIGNYTVVTDGDVGVDGYGIGVDGLPATVQLKNYMANAEIVTGDLKNFEGASYRVYNVPVNSKTKHMIIITAAKGLNYFTDNVMFQNVMHVIGREQLRKLVDNNVLFWDGFRTLVREALA